MGKRLVSSRFLALLSLVCLTGAAARTVSAQQCFPGSFRFGSPSTTGGFDPRSLAVADFDRDGFLDVAVGEVGSGSVSILLQDPFGFGNVQFLPPVPFGFPSVDAIDTADLNHDGRADVVVSGGPSNQVYVSLGDGLGGLGPFTSFNVGSMPGAPLVEDFDKDGHLDIAVVNTGDRDVSLLLGDGTGDFAAPATLPIPIDGVMATADVDGDGNLDLIGTDFFLFQLTIALGNGDGTFQAPIVDFLALDPRAISIEDVIEDGIPDVILAGTSGDEIHVYQGQGDGTFVLTAFSPVFGPVQAPRFDLADFDRDGHLDILIPLPLSWSADVYLGDGAGNFALATGWSPSGEVSDAVAADFSRDGRVDFVMSNRDFNEIQSIINETGIPCGTPGFEAAKPSFDRVGGVLDSGFGSDPQALALGDFDRDGNPDTVTANFGNSTVGVHLGTGGGRFSAVSFYSTGTGPRTIAAGDFTSDGIDDLVTANFSSASILIGDGFGGFGPPSNLALPGGAVQVLVADVSQDGKNDLIVSLDFNDVVVALGDGTGVFGPFVPYPVGPNPGSVTVDDFNKDGLPDIAVLETGTATVEVLLGTGGGVFTPGPSLPVFSAPASLLSGDFDGDTNPDLAISAGFDASGRVQVILGDGFGVFAPPIDSIFGGTPGAPHGLAAADVDGNGSLDLVVTNGTAARLEILLGNGAGAFIPSGWVAPGEDTNAVVAADFNRDGDPDLATAHDLENRASLFFGDGSGSFGPLFLPTSAGTSTGPVTGDFDRNGLVDLAVANTDTDEVSVFLSMGGGVFAPELTFPVMAGGAPTWITAADFDLNGTLDLLVSNSLDASVAMLPGDGFGNFFPPFPSVTPPSPGRTVARDFDHDGKLDIAVLAGSDLSIHIGDGLGGFGPGPSFPLGGTGVGLVAGDVDRDGNVDLVTSESTNGVIQIFIGDAFGSFSPGFQFVAPGIPGAIDLGDLDLDGILDLVVPLEPDFLEIYKGDGLGGFSFSFGVITTFGTTSAKITDINADGTDDILVLARDGNAVSAVSNAFDPIALFMDFENAVNTTIGINRPAGIAVGDFDNDTLVDFAVTPDTMTGETAGVSVVFNSNCRTKRLVLATDASSCDSVGTPLGSQPSVEIQDDGGNLIKCEADPVLAGILAGTGPGGANLLGTTLINPTSGVASFFDLAVDLPGGGYQLEMTHPTARPVLSRSFSQGLTVAISGPTALCEGDPSIYDSGPEFDMYSWFLDGGPVSMAQSVDLTGLSPGAHGLTVDASRDSCTTSDSIAIDVTANLTDVFISTPGPTTVCPTCTGGLVTATPTGGGATTYQWGYRTVSLGAITPLAGETASTYALEGSDFPGPGNYFLVVTATPSCGSPLVSNEIAITVSGAGGPTPLTVLTARSQGGENHLEWVVPGGACSFVRILRRDDGSFPADPNDIIGNTLVGDVPCSPGNTTDFAVTDDVKYFYSAFVSDGSSFSLRKTITGRPFDHTVGRVRWAFSTGATSLSPPAIRSRAGVTTVYVLSNDNVAYAVTGGSGGGFWLAGFQPFVMFGPAQARPPVIPLPIGTGAAQGTNGAVILGSQDGNVYAVDADEGDLIWQSAAGTLVQAAPAGMFSEWGGNDVFAVGVRQGATNEVAVLDRDSGAPVLTFTNAVPDGDGTAMGFIGGMASVDYKTLSVFFASRKGSGVHTLWSIDTTTGTLNWGTDVGDADGSPIFVPGTPNKLVVGNNVGQVHMVNAATGASLWAAPYDSADNAVKSFVFPQFGTDNYIFSTSTLVTSIQDQGATSAKNWDVTLPSPSTPLYVSGMLNVLVGGGDGRLYEIENILTASPTIGSIQLGDGGAGVGSPSLDVRNTIVYVGSEEGVVYAIQLPVVP